MKKIETDIAVIGAGPAGAAASLFLAKKGIKHVIFDKAEFPRDKICGDGLSGKVVALFNELDENIVKDMDKDDNFLDSWGVRFVAPNGKGFEIPFSIEGRESGRVPGYTAKRIDFDNFLAHRLNGQYTSFYRKWDAKKIVYSNTNDGVSIYLQNETEEMICECRVVVGAEGDRSITAKKFAGYRMQPRHYFAGLRAYYTNVGGLHQDNFIELHFIPEALPGYFWVFPLSHNQANVGLGVLSSDVRSKKLNLREIFNNAITKNDELKHRFKDAEIVDKLKGWGLPLGSMKMKRSGDRFLLAGDAGSLVDPFTGEGIGNALLSGKLAAQTLENALQKNDFSAKSLKQYDKLLAKEMYDEIKLSHRIQRLVKFPWLFNFVINRVEGNPAWQDTFSSMFNDLDMRAKLRSPGFYLRLLRKK